MKTDNQQRKQLRKTTGLPGVKKPNPVNTKVPAQKQAKLETPKVKKTNVTMENR